MLRKDMIYPPPTHTHTHTPTRRVFIVDNDPITIPSSGHIKYVNYVSIMYQKVLNLAAIQLMTFFQMSPETTIPWRSNTLLSLTV